MTMQSIFEEDKERLLSRISEGTRDTVIRELQAELDRILVTFNDAEPSEAVQTAVSAMMQTARSAVGLLDTEGTPRIYGRREYPSGAGEEDRVKGRRAAAGKKPKPPVHFWLFLGAVVLFLAWTAVSALPLLQTSDGSAYIRIPAGVALAAAMAFAAGSSYHKATGPSGREELHAETAIDPQKACRQLLSVILTMDQAADGIRTSLELQRRRELSQKSAGADPAELELMAQLLEDAYSWREEDEQAEEMCTHLKYYLHQKNIDVVDYEGLEEAGQPASEKEALLRQVWFDMIPAYAPGTIRPALVMQGILLKKGLASNG